MTEHRSSEHGRITIQTVVITLTILGVLGVVVIGIGLAIAGFTKFGIVLLALFGMQAFYGWTLWRKMPRPAIASLQHEPPDEPDEPEARADAWVDEPVEIPKAEPTDGP